MKYVLVTGACGGMGKATVQKLKNLGFFVFALDKKMSEEEEENVFPLQADVTNEESIQNAFEKVKEKTDELFAIIHFSGIYALDSLVEIQTEKFDKVFDINFRGVFLVNKIFLPLLKNGSRILMTTSELAPLSPLPFTGIYAISKSTLDKYAFSLKMKLQLLGISVSVLRAGAVETNMLGDSISELDKFCNKTELYECNAKRFKKIVESVESKSIKTEKLAKKVCKIINKKKPKFAFSINRNPLLRLLNILPEKTQFEVIKKVLK